jgi:hypothetical protein
MLNFINNFSLGCARRKQYLPLDKSYFKHLHIHPDLINHQRKKNRFTVYGAS